MNNPILPHATDDLIKELVKLIPPPTVKPGLDPDKIFYDAGRYSVVQYLLELQKQRNTPALFRQPQER